MEFFNFIVNINFVFYLITINVNFAKFIFYINLIFYTNLTLFDIIKNLELNYLKY